MDAALYRWTRAHTLCVFTLGTSIPALALVAGFGSVPSSLLAAAIILVLWMVGLVTTPLIGLIAGLLGAVGILMLRFIDPALQTMGLLPVAAIILGTTAAGTYAGLFGRRLRWDARPTYVPEPSVYPNDNVLGPHGFLNAEYGEARIDEEVHRARQFSRPLSLLRIHSTLREDASAEAAALEHLAQRSMATSVEGTIRETDIPLATGEHEIFCILPETNRSKASIFASLVVDHLASTRVSVPESEQVLPLPSILAIHVSTATLEQDGSTSTELIDSLRNKANEQHVRLESAQVLNSEGDSTS